MTGNIQGTVTDASGGPVENAHIVAIDQRALAKQKTVSDGVPDTP